MDDLFTNTYPLEFISFSSGSNGNCYILRKGSQCILIDLGIGIRSFKRYLYQYGLHSKHFVAAFATHDHTDHCKSLGKFATETGIPVYTTASVHEGMKANRFMGRKVPDPQIRTLQVGQPIEVAGITFTAFPVPHDSKDCVGYSIQDADVSLCIATDIGSVTPAIQQAVSQAQYVVIEANYDLPMLATGRYPQFLKDRIRGGRGHLSNDETADLLAECLSDRVKHVWLCHLSEENNTPAQALQTITQRLQQAGRQPGIHFQLEALPRTRPIEFCTLC